MASPEPKGRPEPNPEPTGSPASCAAPSGSHAGRRRRGHTWREEARGWVLLQQTTGQKPLLSAECRDSAGHPGGA